MGKMCHENVSWASTGEFDYTKVRAGMRTAQMGTARHDVIMWVRAPHALDMERRDGQSSRRSKSNSSFRSDGSEMVGEDELWIEMSAPDGSKHDIRVWRTDQSIPLEKVLATKVFLDWVDACEADPCLFIFSVHIQSVAMFGPSRVGFIKFESGEQATCEPANAIDFSACLLYFMLAFGLRNVIAVWTD